jgi:hypothetical protein
MPTALPRTSITHTPAVRRALDVATSRWPGKGDRELLINLALKGAQDIETELNDERQQLLSVAGSMPGVVTPEHLRRLRDEWPS